MASIHGIKHFTSPRNSWDILGSSWVIDAGFNDKLHHSKATVARHRPSSLSSPRDVFIKDSQRLVSISDRQRHHHIHTDDTHCRTYTQSQYSPHTYTSSFFHPCFHCYVYTHVQCDSYPLLKPLFATMA